MAARLSLGGRPGYKVTVFTYTCVAKMFWKSGIQCVQYVHMCVRICTHARCACIVSLIDNIIEKLLIKL